MMTALAAVVSGALTAGACNRSPAAQRGAAGAKGASETVSVQGAPVNATAADVLRAVQTARGNVVLLNVWATWCEPCRHEFPNLLRLRRELGGRNFRLILVSADFPDQLSQVQEFLAQEGVSFPTYLKSDDDIGFINTLDRRWSGALPATFLYDTAGELREFWEGETSYKALAGKVLGLLSGAAGRELEGGSR